MYIIQHEAQTAKASLSSQPNHLSTRQPVINVVKSIKTERLHSGVVIGEAGNNKSTTL